MATDGNKRTRQARISGPTVKLWLTLTEDEVAAVRTLAQRQGASQSLVLRDAVTAHLQSRLAKPDGWDVRRPRDEFEASLMRAELLRMAAQWEALMPGVEVSIGQEPNKAGCWSLALSRPIVPFDLLTILAAPQVDGTCWFTESGGCGVTWILPPGPLSGGAMQTNMAAYPPIVRWDAA